MNVESERFITAVQKTLICPSEKKDLWKGFLICHLQVHVCRLLHLARGWGKIIVMGKNNPSLGFLQDEFVWHENNIAHLISPLRKISIFNCSLYK